MPPRLGLPMGARSCCLHSRLAVGARPARTLQPTSHLPAALFTTSASVRKRLWQSQKYQGPDPPQFDAARRVTVEEVSDRRTYEGRLVAPTASSIPSRAFMRESNAEDPRGPPMDWTNHLTSESKSREPCTLKVAAKRFLPVENIISLGGGLPDPDMFPVENIAFFVHKSPFFSHVEGAPFTRILNHKSRIGQPTNAVRQHDVQPPIRKRMISKYELQNGREYDLAVSMNYAQAAGSPQMVRWVTEHTEIAHWPQYRGWACAMTVGSTGALEQVFRMVLERGETLVTEQFAFSTMLETARPQGINLCGIATDEEGMVPSALEERLLSWDEATQGKKPKVIYLVPTGSNPIGTTMSTERRQMIYHIAKVHDMVIVEDDPYHFLQFSPSEKKIQTPELAEVWPPPSGNPEVWATSEITQSFLHLDTDGRVIRLDTFSKICMPGLRMGWITAPEKVVERFVRHSEVASQGPSGLSQIVAHKILDKEDGGWGHNGYFDWAMALKKQYQRRRDIMLSACEEYLGGDDMTGIVSYHVPKAGMFMWITLEPRLHPNYSDLSLIEMETQIFERAVAAGVLVARGSWFLAERPEGLMKAVAPETGTPGKPFPEPDANIKIPLLGFRLTYAAASKDDIKKAVQRFGKAIRRVFSARTERHEFSLEMDESLESSENEELVSMAAEEEGHEVWRAPDATHLSPYKKKGFVKTKRDTDEF